MAMGDLARLDAFSDPEEEMRSARKYAFPASRPPPYGAADYVADPSSWQIGALAQPEKRSDIWKKIDQAQFERDIVPDTGMPYGTTTPQQFKYTEGPVADALVPQQPWEWGLAASQVLPGPLKAPALATGIIGSLIDPAEAGKLSMLIPRRASGEAMGGVADLYRGYPAPERDITKLQPRNIRKYVDDPQRVFAPGVYKRPDVIAREAAESTAPEHQALKELFGVSRDDLWEIGERGRRKGNVDPTSVIWMPDKSSGSNVAEAIMNPRNAQRMIDAMAEAEKYPQLTRGMDAWYVMDPAFQRMVQLVGREQAIKDYQRFNAISTPFSSNATVQSELNRGTAANMMAARGEFPTFRDYAGMAETERGADFPSILRDVASHVRHGNQFPPAERYLETGSHGFAPGTVKNPLYSLASGVPETGFQTSLPIPDAHLVRASGMADVRKSKTPGVSMKGPEYRPFGPWYRENVAAPLDLEAVPAQGRMWGVFAPQTGVKTQVGAPKLEILSQLIWDRAQRLGIDPKLLRDQVLTGKGHATWLTPTTMGALAARDRYTEQ